MKLFNVSLIFALVLAFLMAPSCAFANENSCSASALPSYSAQVDSTLDDLNPMVKGSSGGSKSSGSSSSSKKVKTDSDDDGNSTDDGSGNNSWIWIIVIIVIIAGIFGVWYFFLRK